MNYTSKVLIVYALVNIIGQIARFVNNVIQNNSITYSDLAANLILFIAILIVAGAWHLDKKEV